MRWRFWLIELPAKALEFWFTFYWTLLTVICAGIVLVTVAALVLALFGIRWGW
jgi:hypothetical protein